MAEKTIMEEKDSIRTVTPYELATLAARINHPERCVNDPKGAIAAAERLLEEAEAAIERADPKHLEKQWQEARRCLAEGPRIDWVQAAKRITGQKRRDRAEQSFLTFMKHAFPQKWQEKLSLFKREGVTQLDIYYFEPDFWKWRHPPKRKKGKQGRRISEHDGRLRTQLLRLVPTKPRKRI